MKRRLLSRLPEPPKQAHIVGPGEGTKVAVVSESQDGASRKVIDAHEPHHRRILSSRFSPMVDIAAPSQISRNVYKKTFEVPNLAVLSRENVCLFKILKKSYPHSMHNMYI